MNTNLIVLIVSPPGDLQIGLQALLAVHLDADVLAVGKVSSALKVIERHYPALIILDQDLPQSIWPGLMHHIKANWPEIICIVLANDDQGRQKIISGGADLIVIKGLPGSKLIAKIKRLLDEEQFKDKEGEK